MGAIAEGLVEYARPLLEMTDGSPEQMNKAMSISTTCWNIALLPAKDRAPMLQSVIDELREQGSDLADSLESLLDEMVHRHEQMFPQLHQRHSRVKAPLGPWGTRQRSSSSSASSKLAEIGRYDPCPCNSGEKYKFCCGRRATREG